ncbi:MAG: hypothetical protein WBE91_05130 [Steroidobacteraceae bacterium]
MSAATPEGILRAVEAQRSRLMNVVGVVQALKIAARDEPPRELEGALELVEQQMQDALEALEGPALERTAAGLGEESRP